MSTTKIPIKITLVTDEALAKNALAFITQIAKEKHDAAPPPPPDVLFAALKEDKVVGTIALDFSEHGKPLPLEEIYAFTNDPFLGAFERAQMIQYGRWMSSIPGISQALAYIATVFALKKGKTRGWFEAKPFIAERLKEIGMDLSPLPGATLLLDRIPSEGKSYYTKPPQPQIYTMYLEPFRNTLLPQIEVLIKDQTITMDRAFLN